MHDATVRYEDNSIGT